MAAVLGAAPHVLHHVGPLAGAALLSGASGRLLFGALGFVLAIPLLLRIKRRHGSWLPSALTMLVMVVVFAISTFVIGPLISGENEPASGPGSPPSQNEEHDVHHE